MVDEKCMQVFLEDGAEGRITVDRALSFTFSPTEQQLSN